MYSEQGVDMYVLPTLFSVDSEPRARELIAALQAVIDRHDVLRTSVLWEQLPRPVQVVQREVRLPIEHVSLDAASDARHQIQEWLRPERQRMDLRRAPLVQLKIAKDPHREQWYVLMQLHHIVVDGVSLRMVISEVITLIEGRPEILVEPVPYRNHVARALAHSRSRDPESFFRNK